MTICPSRISAVVFLLIFYNRECSAFHLVNKRLSLLPKACRQGDNKDIIYRGTGLESRSLSLKASSSDSRTESEKNSEDEFAGDPICRIVTKADAKLPPRRSRQLPPSLSQSPYLLDRLDAYYNAQAHKRTQSLKYLHFRQKQQQPKENDEDADNKVVDREEDGQKLVSVVRTSLEDAGFQLLSRRDFDLCEALNAGYLLRLSIVPDLNDLDPEIAQEFYPERFLHPEDVEKNQTDKSNNNEDLLFDGRVLVYWRGYSEEVTKGRLLLPKIDYLQASLVQRSAISVKRRLDSFERDLTAPVVAAINRLKLTVQKFILDFVDSFQVDFISKRVRTKVEERNAVLDPTSTDDRRGSIKLGRYGGSKMLFLGSPNPADALDPFMICEVNYDRTRPSINKHEEYMLTLNKKSPPTEFEFASVVEQDIYEEMNYAGYTCEYDAQMSGEIQPDSTRRFQLLERVSIGDLVDLFSSAGRRKLIKTIFSKSELVEPTYEEVVVVWRPLIKSKTKIYPPKFVTDLAELLDIDGFEGPPKNINERQNLEIRNFESVQMSNLQAVLPKTKLIFRPADALLNDLISVITLLLVASSVKLNSPRLDLLALISVALWSIRTAFRYSNRLARYDLVVKNFLTSKISHRNAGALKYVVSEAGSQRAIRAALVHTWISRIYKASLKITPEEDPEEGAITRSFLQDRCADEVNKLLFMNRNARIDEDRALRDLEDLGLIRFSKDGEELIDVKDRNAIDVIRAAWLDLLDDVNVEDHKSFKDVNNKPSNDDNVTDMARRLFE